MGDFLIMILKKRLHLVQAAQKVQKSDPDSLTWFGKEVDKGISFTALVELR